MDNLKHFSLPLYGMKNGIHTFTFELNSLFFKEFEQSLIKKGNFNAEVKVEKGNNLVVMHSEIKGFMETNCDRCLANINLPLMSSNSIHVKTGDPLESDDEILYIDEESDSIHIAAWLYESIHVSIPMTKVYNCLDDEVKPCSTEVLHYLEREMNSEKDYQSPNIFKNIKL
ncbi:MAG: YceD family protein [Saprospiraceae bacterium]